MKKVLVITYYWPPSGGAGVQRWLKFSKYLPEYGWQPVIYTPENPEAPVNDDSLQKDVHPETVVIKKRIREPYLLYKRFLGKASGDRINAGFLAEQEKPDKKEGLSVWIRGNWFIPDARKFWINPSVRYLIPYLRNNPVDAVISTGPPHSMHLIARKLKKRLKIPWIADFRDPWTEIDYYNQLKLTRRSDQKHRNLERAVLQEADRVVVIGNTMAERFNTTQGITPVVISNGFDEADFTHKKGKAGTGFSIVHIGAMNQDRNHASFWETVAELVAEEPHLSANLKIRLVGKLDHSVHRMISTHNLGEFVEIQAHLPHDQITDLLQSAAVLYLPINQTPNARSIQTGKLFEYLAAGRPILGTGPEDGDAAAVLKECRAGVMVGFNDKVRLKEVLKEWIRLYLKGKLNMEFSGIETYSRRNLTGRLAEQLDQLNRMA